MVKIFSKLKLIIGVTVLLITLLFGILIFKQYDEMNTSIKLLNKESATNLSHDISIILDFYSKLATSYFEESFSTNENLHQLMNTYNDNRRPFKDITLEQLHDELEPVFNNANKNGFSYIRLYDYNHALIKTLSDNYPVKEATYHFTYSLFDANERIGYIELGLPSSAVVGTLDRTTGLSTFTIQKKDYIDLRTKEELLNHYSPALLNTEYYVENGVIMQHNSYLSQAETTILDDFSTAIRSRIYEPLLTYENFSINKAYNGNYYTLVFITLDNDMNKENGYYVLFTENQTLTTLRENSFITIGLFVGLYLTILFIIAFIYYIIHYLYNFSYTDNLTKAYNRHKFFEVIKHNIYDFHRYNYMFSVILIDIDNFKSINDQLGHNVGDEVLVGFADIIQSSLRTTDYLFRWGGEEFLVLLSHCDGKLGFQVSEKLRHNLENHNFNLKNGQQVTASFGVSSYKSSTNIEMLISHADKALYISKEEGKNRTTLYSPDSDQVSLRL